MPEHTRYGIISDIHSNFQALKETLEYMRLAEVEKIFCLGDLVGYGAEPLECVQALKDRPDVVTIGGNHDRQVLGDRDPRMRKSAIQVLDWTLDQLGQSNARYLRQLPEGMAEEDVFILVHGSLLERDAYILSAEEIEQNLDCMEKAFPGTKLCFFGHTHVPMLLGRNTVITDLRETKAFQLDKNEAYLINPGSVGQPRDRCPLTSFAIFDATTWALTFVRRPYDVAQAQKAITDNGLPVKFARRLAVGV